MRLLAFLVVVAALTSAAPAVASSHGKKLSQINHIVVIYEENHSFDNLYGGWEGVNGLANADPPHTIQVDQAGNPFRLPAAERRQPDVAAAAVDLHGHHDGHDLPRAHFGTRRSRSTTTSRRPPRRCPAPGVNAPTGSPTARAPGGCTRDLVHQFYQEQYQLDGGKQDRYVTGSDASG